MNFAFLGFHANAFAVARIYPKEQTTLCLSLLSYYNQLLSATPTTEEAQRAEYREKATKLVNQLMSVSDSVKRYEGIGYHKLALEDYNSALKCVSCVRFRVILFSHSFILRFV